MAGAGWRGGGGGRRGWGGEVGKGGVRGEGRRERRGEAARGTFKFLHRPMNPKPRISRTRVGRVREIRRDREAWGGATFDFSYFPFSMSAFLATTVL